MSVRAMPASQRDTAERVHPHLLLRSAPQAAREGYTLAEMLVVLAIIAIMAAIVIPRFAIKQKGTGLKSGATELMTGLRAARRSAIQNRELRALALDIYSIPAKFVTMRARRTGEPTAPLWIMEGELHALPDNIAIVAVTIPGWGATDTVPPTLDVSRTDDYNLDTVEDNVSSSATIFNPELKPNGDPGPNGQVNMIYHLINFEPTGTADSAVIYLWNIEEGRRELPNASIGQAFSNLTTLGIPPGFLINDATDQLKYLKLPADNLPEDSYYYTVVVNPITGAVIVYDYAWGSGAHVGSRYEWDRKKDGS